MTLLYFFLFVFLLLGIFALVAVYAERKLSGFIQDRPGPLETGYKGVLQTLADIIKLISKEIVRPKESNYFLFYLAPIWVFACVAVGFYFIPMHKPYGFITNHFSIILILLFSGLEVLGILMAGLAANNKFAILGSFRSISQMVSYEIPVWISIFSIALWYGTFDISQIIFKQGFTIPGLFAEGAYTNISHSEVGILGWTIFRQPIFILSFLLYFVSTLAFCNRAPFDLVEAESEIVSGYHTEYSGIAFALFFLAEYGLMLLFAMLGVNLFLGGGMPAFPAIFGHAIFESDIWYSVCFFGKTAIWVFLQMTAKWVLPRLRFDRWMKYAWTFFIPSSIVIFVLILIIKTFIAGV